MPCRGGAIGRLQASWLLAKHGYPAGCSLTGKALDGRECPLENMEVNKSFWLDRPTFVTGGTGLVGNWLMRRLIEAGADITCLVRDWVPQSEVVRTGLIEKVKVVRGDIREREVIERTLGEYEIDT